MILDENNIYLNALRKSFGLSTYGPSQVEYPLYCTNSNASYEYSECSYYSNNVTLFEAWRGGFYNMIKSLGIVIHGFSDGGIIIDSNFGMIEELGHLLTVTKSHYAIKNFNLYYDQNGQINYLTDSNNNYLDTDYVHYYYIYLSILITESNNSLSLYKYNLFKYIFGLGDLPIITIKQKEVKNQNPIEYGEWENIGSGPYNYYGGYFLSDYTSSNGGYFNKTYIVGCFFGNMLLNLLPFVYSSQIFNIGGFVTPLHTLDFESFNPF